MRLSQKGSLILGILAISSCCTALPEALAKKQGKPALTIVADHTVARSYTDSPSIDAEVRNVGNKSRDHQIRWDTFYEAPGHGRRLVRSEKDNDYNGYRPLILGPGTYTIRATAITHSGLQKKVQFSVPIFLDGSWEPQVSWHAPDPGAPAVGLYQLICSKTLWDSGNQQAVAEAWLDLDVNNQKVYAKGTLAVGFNGGVLLTFHDESSGVNGSADGKMDPDTGPGYYCGFNPMFFSAGIFVTKGGKTRVGDLLCSTLP